MKKFTDILQYIFGYGIMICLLSGGLTFFGYIAALCIGGELAASICYFIYKVLFPIIIKASTVLVLFGLVIMYLKGEVALSISKSKKAGK